MDVKQHHSSHNYPCPRCGYDLSGVVDSWTEQCPVEGVCSECGLKLKWRNLLDPSLAQTSRFFESQHRWWLKDVVTTAIKSLRPKRFWRWADMSYAINAQRAALAACFGTLTYTLILVPFVAILMTVAIVFVKKHGAQVQSSYTSTFTQHARDLLFGWSDATAMLLVPALLLVPAVFASMILTTVVTLMILNDSFKTAHVRKVHLVRLAIYPFVGLPLICVPLIVWWLVAWTINQMNASWWYSPLRPSNVPGVLFRTDWIEPALFTTETGMLAAWFTLNLKYFLGDYLRLPNSWRDSVVLCILSFLIGAPVSVIALAVIVHSLL